MSPSSDRNPVEFLSHASRSLWAKTGEDGAWLSLPQHMLDSVGVAEQLWDEWLPESVKRSLMSESGLDPSELRATAVFLAGIHDIGKAIIPFQFQLERFSDRAQFGQRVRDAGFTSTSSHVEKMMEKFPHSLASGLLVESWLVERGVRAAVATTFASVVDAHHGIPSERSVHDRARFALQHYPGEWRAAQREMLDWISALTGFDAILPLLRKKLFGPALNLLSGFVIMCDWIASNADGFPLTDVVDQTARINRGMQIDLTPPWEPNPPDEHELADHMRQRFDWQRSYAPRPIQAAVDATARRCPGATLMIIEAPTGEGKTEAALLAAEHLGAASGAGGVIIAAPTMSTADGLLARTIDWAERASAPGQVISMFLGHSKARLNRTFEQLRFRGIGPDEEAAAKGTAIASSWMTGRKKGILSSFCVATVDQVLFMALQSRHSMLRHLGLAGKVVVIDEVHAYDAYMTEYLGTALQWLGRYGIPVVLLSATLPVSQRRTLIDAYESSFAFPSDRELSTAYPLITTVGAGGFEEICVDSRDPDLHALVSLVDDGVDQLCAELSGRLHGGGCALVICNTIRRAQDAYSALAELYPGEVELHHAGFMAADRVRKEERLREALGPCAARGNGRSERRIIVATQVAEQSLDIDADLLVSDIAPIDLLIQRIGRLHRHPRPDDDRPPAVRTGHVLVRGVLTDDPEPEFDGGATAVYEESLLIATLAVLKDRVLMHGFTRPDDTAPLVHATYRADPSVPAAWLDALSRARTKSDGEREAAQERSRTWRFPPPSHAASLGDQFKVRDKELGEQVGLAQVRDSDPSIEVIPVMVQGGAYAPLPWTAYAGLLLDPGTAPPDEIARDLAGCTVRLPRRLSQFESRFKEVLDLLEPATPAGWAQSRWLNGELALPLDPQLGVVLAGRRLVYDRELGLIDTTDPDVASFVRPGL